MTSDITKFVSGNKQTPDAGFVSGVRDMYPDDLEEVGQLFNRVFRKSSKPASPELLQYLKELLFESPVYKDGGGSLVHIGARGHVDSALLSLPMEFIVNGQSVLGKLLFAFMADEDAKIGAGLLSRRMNAKNQGFSFSDTASPVSAQHWLLQRGHILPIQSLDWEYAFRPITAKFLRLGRRYRFLKNRYFLALIGMLDRITQSFWHSLKTLPEISGQVVAGNADSYLHCARPMIERFAIRPAWTDEEFYWLIQLAGQNKALGKLQYRIVYDDNGEEVGAFLFVGQPAAQAIVLNIVCKEKKENHTFQAMMASLRSEGYALVSGITQPFLMNSISAFPRVVYRTNGQFCFASKQQDITEAMNKGDVYIGGLASEAWSRLLTDL